MICAIFTSSRAGYLYPRPTIPFELPAKVNAVQQQSTVDDTSDLQESTVSFSLPLEDYNYLKQHKAEYHISPFNDPQAANAQISHSSQLQSTKAESSVLQKIEVQSDIVQTDIDTASEHVLIGNQYITSEENLEVANVFPQTVPLIHDNPNKPREEILINNHLTNTVGSQTLLSSTVSPLENHYANEAGRTQNNFGQQVTRHIYFHVPPPDLEEPPLVRITKPPKKVYKIIFIKVPAQETSNTAQIKQALYNQIAPVEDKTLIYVLVKKPEPVPVHPPPRSVPSEHEVLFVKYRDNRFSADSPAIRDLLAKRSVQNKELKSQG